MNMQVLVQVREKLKEEYDKNCLIIDELDKKISILISNSLGMKFSFALLAFTIPWLVATLLMPVASKIIPSILVHPLSIGIPALIGIATEKILYKKFRYQEKLREFSTSKTSKEILEERTRYEIEKKKLENINKILDHNMNELLANKHIINSLETRYNITIKDDNSNKTEEQMKANIQKIEKILADKQQTLNNQTTKCVLNEKIGGTRTKFDRYFSTFLYSVMSGIICMTLYDFPLIFFNILKSTNLSSSIFSAIAPLVVGSVAYGIFFNKSENEKKDVFKKLNKELGSNALPEFSDSEEDIQLDKDLKNTINDICTINIQLEIEKQRLEHATSTHNNQNNVCDSAKKLEDHNLTHDINPIVNDGLNFVEQLENYEELVESQSTQEVQKLSLRPKN